MFSVAVRTQHCALLNLFVRLGEHLVTYQATDLVLFLSWVYVMKVQTRYVALPAPSAFKATFERIPLLFSAFILCRRLCPYAFSVLLIVLAAL